MVRISLLLLAFCGLVRSVPAQDIAAVAASPYDLAKFVETHSDFDWEPLWKTLGVTDEDISLPRCEQDFQGVAACSSELITVVDPLQTIVLIEHRMSMFQVFLRYTSSGAGLWRFSGAYQPSAKYFRPEHRIFRFGAKPILSVTGQGSAGTGLSSKIENWIDLAAEDFKPILEFTSKGDNLPCGEGIGRHVHGLVTRVEEHPIEQVTVGMSIEFTVMDGCAEVARIGLRMDRLTYVRAGDGNFKLQESLSTASAEEVERFYDDLDAEFTDEDFLKFNFAGFMDVAKGKDEEARLWLSSFLQRCPDTPESRQLSKLLTSPR